MNLHKENYNSEVLVQIWTDFIDREKRRIGESGFLINTLKINNCHKIFDACLGDGADSIYLLQNGFDVISNDVDELFIAKAKENAEKYDVALHISKYNWQDISKEFSQGMFDAVICLGNSLTYIFDEKDQMSVLKNFYNVLGDKGILIIDERNYQRILDERLSILNTGKFSYSKKYVYCGNKVEAKPISIDDNEVVFEYIHSEYNKIGHLTMYPFKSGELLSLLQKSGFTNIQQYSDYQKGYNVQADFYQYICYK